MNATLLSFDLRGRRLSSLALLGAAALAACDNDRPVGPNPTAIPTEASAAKVAKGNSLFITIVDENGATPTTVGAQFTVGQVGQPTYFLVDNIGSDADPTPNTLQMKGLIGTYNVCQTVAPTDYVLATPACQSVTLNDQNAKLQFVNANVGHAVWTVLDFNGVGIGGAVITWHDGNGNSFQVADNSALDLDKADGVFEVKAPYGGGGACSLTPPPGWVFGTTGCFGQPVPPGQKTFFINFNVNPEYSVNWAAIDPNGLAGPSTYTVTNAAGTFTATIDDDGNKDGWKGLGQIWMIVPGPGEYRICQTTPPPNTKIADPSCVVVSPIFGDPTYAGTFVSEWK